MILILVICYLLVYGFRLMARLDRFLFPAGTENLLRAECAGKHNVFLAVLILYFSGESLHCIAQMLSLRLRRFRKNRKDAAGSRSKHPLRTEFGQDNGSL